MPWNLLISIFALFVFGGCATHPEIVQSTQTHEKATVEQEVQPIIDIDNMSEDSLFMASVLALQNSQTELASRYLEQLYKTTKKEIYLYQLTQLLSQSGKNAEALAYLEDKSKTDPENTELKRSIITLLLINNETDKAKQLASQIAQKTKLASDYDLSASILIHLQDYAEAEKELKIAYSLSPDESILDKLATIEFVNLDKKQEAIALYETHIKLYGCSRFICQRLLLAYEQLGLNSEAIAIYKKLYTKFNDQDAIRRVVELYLAEYKVDELIEFLQNTKADNIILLEAYKYKKDYVMASRTAMVIYNKTKDPKFLAQSAVYKFEANRVKSPRVIKDVVQKLTTALYSYSDDLFVNYLGYILIDYNVDIDKGVSYIKKALAKDPKSPFYLDSLAWGQYKQKRYKEAYENIKIALDGAKDDPTVKEHYDEIKKYLDKK